MSFEISVVSLVSNGPDFCGLCYCFLETWKCVQNWEHWNGEQKSKTVQIRAHGLT